MKPLGKEGLAALSEEFQAILRTEIDKINRVLESSALNYIYATNVIEVRPIGYHIYKFSQK